VACKIALMAGYTYALIKLTKGVVFDSLELRSLLMTTIGCELWEECLESLFACCYGRIGDPCSIHSAHVGWGSERCEG